MFLIAYLVTNMFTAEAIGSPMSITIDLSLATGDTFRDATLNCNVVGALNYLAFIWPDISIAINKLCQFMNYPSNHHWTAVKRVLRYHKATLHYGLLLHPSSSRSLVTCCDADWICDCNDRCSTASYCIFFGSNLISCSRKQSIVAHTSIEAKYHSIPYITPDVTWLLFLFHGPGSSYLPLVVQCDNTSTTYSAANLVFHVRTKHVEIDFHFLWNRLQIIVCFRYVSSLDQPTDVLTKPLHVPSFEFIRASFKPFLCLSA